MFQDQLIVMINYYHHLKNNIRHRLKLLRKGIILWAITYNAKRRPRHRPFRVLIDNSTLANGVTHESGWISTGKAKWGDTQVDTRYLAVVPVHSPNTAAESPNGARLYNEIRFLPAIAEASKIGIIQLYTSDALEFETLHQPSGRFRGYALGDRSVFQGLNRISLKTLDGFTFTISSQLTEQPIDRLRAYLGSKTSVQPFAALVKSLGPKGSQDAWHIHTATANDLDALLVLDFKLHSKAKQLSNDSALCLAASKVMLPSELGTILGLLPVNPALLTYTEDIFPVPRPDLSMPDNKRRGRRKPP